MQLLEGVWHFIKSHPDVFGIVSALCLATIGYIAKHVSDLRVRRYEARLAFVTSQLRDLYGPLFLLVEANEKTWIEFRKVFRPNRPIHDPPLAKEEKAEYIRWLEQAFVPCNEKMRRVIESSAHLFLEGKAPDVILDLLSHFNELNVVLSKLKDGTGDNVFPNAMYPKQFGTYIKRDYNLLVETHARLTARRRQSGP